MNISNPRYPTEEFFNHALNSSQNGDVDQLEKVMDEKNWPLEWQETFLGTAQHQDLLNECLLVACQRGHLAVVSYLLTSPSLAIKADIHAQYEHVHAQHCFMQACAHGHLPVVDFLLTSPHIPQGKHATIDIEDNKALRLACKEGHLEVVKYLLTSSEVYRVQGKYADMHAKMDEALIMSCFKGHVAIAKYLLTDPELITLHGKPADVHATSDESIMRACATHNIELVKLLLECHADPCAYGYRAFKVTARHAFTDIWNLLCAWVENNEKENDAKTLIAIHANSLVSACNAKKVKFAMGLYENISPYMAGDANDPECQSLVHQKVQESFLDVVEHNQRELINFFIFEARIPLTLELEHHLQPYKEIVSMLQSRDLTHDLPTNHGTPRKRTKV